MATLINNNNGKKITNYAENLAKGIRYETQDEAIMANAKDYAKMDWNTIQRLITKLGLKTKEEVLASALIEVKADIIKESIERTSKVNEMFN